MSDSEEKWIPDEESSACSLCHRPFSIAFRKHHCRSCGSIVCDDCSKSRVELKVGSGEIERVCDKCEVHFSTEGGKGLSEGLRVKGQIAGSLRLALKERQSDTNRFRSLLLTMLEGESSESDIQRQQLLVADIISVKLQQLDEFRTSYNKEHEAVFLAEKESRDLARHILHAEAEQRRVVEVQREINELQETLQNQDVLVDKLRERVQRLESADAVHTSSSSIHQNDHHHHRPRIDVFSGADNQEGLQRRSLSEGRPPFQQCVIQ